MDGNFTPACRCQREGNSDICIGKSISNQFASNHGGWDAEDKEAYNEESVGVVLRLAPLAPDPPRSL